MSETKTFNPEDVFHNYEMQADTHPGELRLGEHGFLQDDKHLYAFRRSSADVQTEDALPTDLYNGSAAGKSFNATEGHGLYVGNAPDATKLPGVKGDQMYCVRVPLSGLELLNTMDAADLSAGQQKAARLHRMRSRMIGVPNLGTKKWDTWYENADVVTFRPMAMARLFLGKNVKLESGAHTPEKVKPTWAVIRDTDKAEVIGKRAA